MDFWRKKNDMINICQSRYTSFEVLKSSNAKVAFDQVSCFHVSKTATTYFNEGSLSQSFSESERPISKMYIFFSPFIAVLINNVLVQWLGVNNPVGIHLLKVNNRNTRARCEICSNLTIKTGVHSGVFIVNFEPISHFVLMFLLLTLNI